LLSDVKQSNRQRRCIRSHQLQFEPAAFQVGDQKRDLPAALLEAAGKFGPTEAFSGVHAVPSLLRVIHC
jgi:hypothetical protein